MRPLWGRPRRLVNVPNLLLFVHSLNSGGAERVTANLANHWARQGWRVTVVTMTGTTDDFYRLHPDVRRIWLNMAVDASNSLRAIGANAHRVLALRRVLRRIRPDVVLAMMTTPSVLLALARTGMRGFVALGSERSYPPRVPLGHAWGRLRAHLYARLDVVVALTNESAEWLKQHTRARRIAVIPNPVTWPLPAQAPRLIPPQPEGWSTLLTVGRLSEEKGFHRLIAIFQAMAAHFPQWRLVILGEGPERKALEAQVRSAGLQQRILLPGRAGNVGEWYAAADLYVLSSRFEGFPNTLAEAMAHGLPAVAFDCDTGPRDIIRDGVDGVLVPAGDTTAMESALRRLMGDAPLRQQLGAEAVEIRSRYSMVRVVGMWERLFQELREASSRQDEATEGKADGVN